MPFKSKAQQRFMYANHPEMAKRWADHTPDIKKLPERVGDEPEKKGLFSMDPISQLAKDAASDRLVEKLASDTKISTDLVRFLASKVDMSPRAFVKAAYDDPAGYTIFLGLVSGAMRPELLTKAAAETGFLKKTLGQALAFMKRTGQGATGAKDPATGALKAEGGFLGTSPATSGIGKRLENAPLLGNAMKSQAGRVAVPGVAAAGAGGTGMMAFGGGKGAPADAGPHEAAVNAQTSNAGVGGMGGGAANPAQQGAAQGPAQTNGPAANPQQQGGGLSSTGKGLLAAGGVGLGALGAGAMMRKRKQRRQKEVTAADVMREAILTKVASLMKRRYAETFCDFIDTVALKMPAEKTASVRVMQAAVSEGVPLSHAIKLGFPTLNGEQRGILGYKLVKAAAAFGKKKAAYKVQTRSEASCKPGEASAQMQKMGHEKQARNPVPQGGLPGKRPGMPVGAKPPVQTLSRPPMSQQARQQLTGKPLGGVPRQSFGGRYGKVLGLLGLAGMGAGAAGIAGQAMGGGQAPLETSPEGNVQAGGNTPMGQTRDAMKVR